MRWTPALLLLLVAACGSGGGAESPADAVTLVALVADGPMGYARWDADGSSIDILDCPENDIPPVRRSTLKHELWHLLTRIEGHPNPRDECVSGSPMLPFLVSPCEAEIAEINEANRVVTISFSEDPLCASECADWWNFWLGRKAVVVVD
jgi:hypothetical protein